MKKSPSEERAYDTLMAVINYKAELGALACREDGGTEPIPETWTIPAPLTELDENWPVLGE